MVKIRVVIVDDQRLFSDMLALLLQSLKTIELLFIAYDAEQLLYWLSTHQKHPSVILTDINLPGMNGIELNIQMSQLYPEIRMVILSVHHEPTLISRVIKDGAAAYLSKSVSREELLKTIQRVQEDGSYISMETMKALQNAARVRNHNDDKVSVPGVLSKRESEIIFYICMDMNTQEIADRLFLSVRTVEGHRSNILGKTGCRSTAGLVLFAIKHGYFTL